MDKFKSGTVSSDHYPIYFTRGVQKWGLGYFKFENMWMEHHSFSDLLKKLVALKLDSRIIFAPSWCVLCHKCGESLMHITVFCDYTQSCWMRIFPCFNYLVVFPNDPLTLLNMLLIGHPFKNEKAISKASSLKSTFGSYGMIQIIVYLKICPFVISYNQ